METKNIIAAISLSAAVIILYSLFFAPSQDELKKIRAEKEKDKIVKNSEAPSLDNENNISTIRSDNAMRPNIHNKVRQSINRHENSICWPIFFFDFFAFWLDKVVNKIVEIETIKIPRGNCTILSA